MAKTLLANSALLLSNAMAEMFLSRPQVNFSNMRQREREREGGERKRGRGERESLELCLTFLIPFPDEQE